VSDELLMRIRSRAADYDRQNGFFFEDLAELAEVGYLRMFVPVELGGLGLSLERVAREQIRWQPLRPTALGINMHWSGQVWLRPCSSGG
jgi:alkylation response protein AidB-like acyl-CoA dehydrogenase